MLWSLSGGCHRNFYLFFRKKLAGSAYKFGDCRHYFFGTWWLLRDSLNLLLDRVPSTIVLEDVRRIYKTFQEF